MYNQQRYVGKLQNGVSCRGGEHPRVTAGEPAERLARAKARDLALADTNEKERDGRGEWLLGEKS